MLYTENFRPWATWVTVFAALLLALQFPVLDPADGVRADGVVYASGARSLLSGDGYRYSVFERAPGIGLYPPGWSLVLVPAIALERATRWSGWIQVWAIACSLVLVHGGFRFLARRGLPLPVAAGVMVSIVLTPSWRDLIRHAYSEPLYLAILYAWLLPAAWDRELDSWRSWLCVGLAAAALVLTRSAGVAVLPAVGLASLWTRRPSFIAAAVLPSLAMMIGWVVWSRDLVGYRLMFESEVIRLTGTPDGRGILFKDNIRALAQGGPLVNGLSPLLFPVPQVIASRLPWVATPPIFAMVVQWGGIAAMSLLGWRIVRGRGAGDRKALGRAAVLVSFAVLTLASVLASPLPVGSLQRYMIPLLPIFAWGTWQGIESITSARPAIRRRLIQIATVLLILNIGSAMALSRTGYPGRDGVRSRSDLIEIAQSLRKIAGPGPAPRVAIDIRNPLLDFVDAIGGPVITDYLDPVDVWQPVRFENQGYPRAEFLVVQVGEVEKRPLLAQLPKVAANRSFVAFQINPQWEAAFRKERGFPPPP